MNFKVKCELMRITPSTANEWLSDKWGEQRNVRTSHVKRLANDMRNGLFKIGPDAILRIKGKLANGQHRLNAVAESGIAQTFLVMESDDEELFKVIDAGVKRTVGDALIGCTYSASIPAVARWVMAYELQSVSKTAFSGASAVAKKFTQIEIINYCQDNLEPLTEAMSYCTPLYNNTKLMPLAVAGALYCIAAQKDDYIDKGRDFLQKVYISGGENAAGDLRNRLIGNKGSRSKIPPGYLFGLSLKALKSFCNDTRPATLKWVDGEPLTML